MRYAFVIAVIIVTGILAFFPVTVRATFPSSLTSCEEGKQEVAVVNLFRALFTNPPANGCSDYPPSLP